MPRQHSNDPRASIRPLDGRPRISWENGRDLARLQPVCSFKMSGERERIRKVCLRVKNGRNFVHHSAKWSFELRYEKDHVILLCSNSDLSDGQIARIKQKFVEEFDRIAREIYCVEAIRQDCSTRQRVVPANQRMRGTPPSIYHGTT